jgi:membrane-anchored protein YejM (alkaline phosphatase superfamily)
MKAASLSQLKQEMKNLSSNDLVEVCLRLIRYKKENKELLTYLLFEMQDEKAYIKSIQKEMEQQFSEINKSNIYYAKKSIRKIVRTTNKFIRYSGKKETEVELLMFFCECLNESGIPMQKSVALNNIYIRQIEKIKKAIGTLHEDLQFDYNEELKGLL